MKNIDKEKTVSSVNNTAARAEEKKNTPGSVIVKILCVLGAFLIWLYVMSNDSPDYEKTFTSVPVSINGAVELENVTGMSVVSGLGHVIDISVYGIKRDVVNLDNDDIVAYVDISDISNAGKYALDVHVEVPDGITVTSVSPDNVTVAVDKTSSIIVNVVPKLTTYNISLDYSLGTLVPEISEISVSGPITVLSTIDRAEVVVGDLGQLTGTVTASGLIQLVDAAGNKITNQFIKIPQDSLKVTVPVYTYKDIPVSVTVKNGAYDPSKISIKYSPETIRVKGDVDTLAAMTEYTVLLDEADIESDKAIIKEVVLPKAVENVDLIEYISLEIKHETETVYVTEFQVENTENIEYEIVTKSLGITFRGRREYLDLLAANNVTVTADLGKMTLVSGQTYDVPVTVDSDINDGKDPVEVSDTYKIQVRVK